MAIKLALLVVFFGIMLAVGVHCRRHATDVNGFVLGGRSVGAWLTAFAYGTSYFSAVIFVGYAGQFGWRFGVASTWIGLGNAFLGSLLAWVVLGRRTRLMSQHLDSATMPEFFGKRFGSRGLKIGASIIVFIFLIPYTASLYNGLSRLFGMAFNIDYTLCIILMAALTCVYVVAGGYMATAINDFIQGLIMLGGIVVVVLAVLNENGGFMAAMDALARVEDASVTTTPRRVHLLLRSQAAGTSRRGHPHLAGHLGASADGAEVLRHPLGKGHPQGRGHLHAVCRGGGGRLLLPRRLRPSLRGPRKRRRRRLRRHHPRDAGKPLAAFDRHRRHTRALGLHVHALQPGHGFQLDPDARPSQGQCRQGHGREKAGADHARPHRGVHRHLRGYRHRTAQE